MENNDKKEITLRWGLALQLILNSRKEINKQIKTDTGRKDKELIDSFGKLWLKSGIHKPSIVGYAQGNNAEITTWMTLLDALGISLSEFAAIHDSITPEQIRAHEAEIEKKRKDVTGEEEE